MLNSNEFVRYARQLMVTDLGEEAQETFSAATVGIVGLGGLGCPASIYLAAAGIGKLVLMDRDKVELGNLYRQVLYRDEDIGRSKAEVATERLQVMNPHIQCEAVVESIDSQELTAFMDDVDLVLDCTDNLDTRLEINRACVAFQKPLISAAAIGWEGQISTFRFDRNPSPCLACVLKTGAGGPPMNCSTAGVIGPVLGTMGSMQATQAIKVLADFEEDDSTWMHRYDGRSGRWISMKISSSPDCPICDPHAD